MAVKKKKWISFLPSIVFLLFIFGMGIALLVHPVKEYSEREKRYLAQRPEVTVENLMSGQAQTDLEKFASDQIPGRDFFVGVNAYWILSTGRNAAQDIYHCREGYLINAPKQTDGTVFQDNLTRFDAFSGNLGIESDLIMVPTTGYLMEDVLPIGHKIYWDDMLYRKASQTVQNLNIIDVRKPLKDEVKSGGQVCYKTDHHLTSLGNYILYSTYQDAKGFWYYPPTAYDVETAEGFYGTTWSGSGYWLTPADALEIWDNGTQVSVTIEDGNEEPTISSGMYFRTHLEELDKYPVFLDGNHSLVTIENPNVAGESILVIRDSYAHCFSTFLAANYRTVYLVDLRYYRDSLSGFLAEHPVNRILYLYGMDNLLTDTNSAWLN